MPAYWVARSRITDPVEYKKYTDCVPAIICKFGGSGARQRRTVPDHGGTRHIPPLRADRVRHLRAGSRVLPVAEYKEAAALRRNGAGEVEMVVVEGGDATKI
jgi:uncharacterized protein (DUF1330 family)